MVKKDITIKLILGDCIEEMKKLPDKCIDMCLTDPPYGTTKCSWDTIIPFNLMWNELNRIVKDTGCVCLFGKQPFVSNLIMSNPKFFKQELIWEKDNFDNPMQAKRRHLNRLENIVLFYRKQCIYNPQGVIEINKITKQGPTGLLSDARKNRKKQYLQTHTNYPSTLLKFKRDLPNIHPTQKPVALLEYLIKTYSLEGQTVLDFTMGSGSTGVACKNLNRNFIGIEKDKTYFDIARKRIDEA